MSRSNFISSCGAPLTNSIPRASLVHTIPGYASLIEAHNGYAIDGGLCRIFGIRGPGLLGRDFEEWSRAEWRETYPVAPSLFFFAENIFGDQFGYDTAAQEFMMFDCEGGQMTRLRFGTVGEWLDSFRLGAPEDWIEVDLVRSAAAAGLVPTLLEHLSFGLPLVCGGEAVVENLEVLDGSMHLSILGQITSQSRSVPEGTKIRGFRTVR